MPIPTTFARVLSLTKAVDAGVVYFDVDPAAERLCVFDRTTLEMYWHGRVETYLKDGKIGVIVPLEYAASTALAAVIFDDTGQYNLVGADRVMAERINLTAAAS